jgi:hypothetical protein
MEHEPGPALQLGPKDLPRRPFLQILHGPASLLDTHRHDLAPPFVLHGRGARRRRTTAA